MTTAMYRSGSRNSLSILIFFSALALSTPQLCRGALLDNFFLLAVSGSAVLSQPLDGAEVFVFSDNGSLHRREFLTDNGTWGPHVVWSPRGPFRVALTGGTAGGEAFTGTLSAYVPYMDIGFSDNETWERGGSVPVTILSTCIDRYMILQDADFVSAREEVAAFFAIPDDVDIASGTVPESVFSPDEFMYRAELYGGFDDYVDSLVMRFGTGETDVMLPENDFAVEIARVGLTRWGLEVLGGAAGGKIASMALGYVLPMLGFETTETHLEAIREELAALKQQLEGISEQVASLSKQLDIAVDQLIHEGTKKTLDEPLDEIDRLYNKMLKIEQYNTSGGSSITQGEIDDFVNTILNQDYLEKHVNTICTSITGSASGSTSILEAMMNLMEPRIDDAGADTEQEMVRCYNLLLHYIDKLVLYQLKGITLVSYAMNARYGLDSGSLAIFLETQQERFEAEADTFLDAATRLVMHTVDTRTILEGTFSMFPLDAQRVLESADYFAAGLAQKHTGDVVVRIIGTPVMVARYLSETPELGYYRFTFEIDRSLPLPVVVPRITWIAHDILLGGSEQVAMGGDIEKHYTPVLPGQYDTDYYLQWTGREDGGYRFSSATEIVAAKVVYDAEWNDDAITMGLEEKEEIRTYLRYADGKLHGSYITVSETGTAEDEDTEERLPAAYCVAVACEMPSFTASREQELPGEGSWYSYLYPAAGSSKIKGRYRLNERYQRDYSSSCDSIMDISAVFENADSRQHTLRFDTEHSFKIEVDGFDHARQHPSYQYTYVGLTEEFSWKLTVDDTSLWERHVQNWKRSCYKNNCNIKYKWHECDDAYADSARADWSAGRERSVAFNAFNNYIRAKALYYSSNPFKKPSPEDDSGSAIEFEYEIQGLEIVPE